MVLFMNKKIMEEERGRRNKSAVAQFTRSGRYSTMRNPVSNISRLVDRRSFMKNGLLAGGAATAGVGLLTDGTSALAQSEVADGSLDARATSLSSDFWRRRN
jgi:hypothetical protein